ncbi:hypothetical protein [Micromonospora sp. DH14]|uniref:hypothetical protein n=1 Tax=Micromonospora sp. DH14 TaxID=3040120 RepID=UPI0024422629|nr:hypothetical protein [Micromonospora sp. DH14]MDG9678129.1 hypothetical protein [Micromonospora sp. DH14]
MAGNESVEEFLRSARELVDLIFTDDMGYFDSLPEVVDRELATPLAGLLNALSDDCELEDVVGAAKLVVEVAVQIQSALPPELAALIGNLERGRQELQSDR